MDAYVARMIVFVRDRVPIVLSVVAVLMLMTAAFIRPQPLPAGVARFADVGPAINPARSPAPGRTYAFDVVFSGGEQFVISRGPVWVTRGETIGIVGWALDSHTLQPASALLAGLDESSALHAVTSYGLERPDVAGALHDSAAGASGFHADISLAGVSTGVHRVRFAVVASDGRRTILPTSVAIVVK